jgi:CBS domain-containing protein
MANERREALPLLEGEAVLGMVTLEDVQRVPAEHRSTTLARESARQTQALSPTDDAWAAFRQLQQQGVQALPVVHEGQLVGIVRPEDFARALKLRSLEDTADRRGLHWPREQET